MITHLCELLFSNFSLFLLHKKLLDECKDKRWCQISVNSQMFWQDPCPGIYKYHMLLTLWDPIDGSPPGSTIPGILQARTLEWVASFKYTQYVPWLLCLLCVLFSFVSFLLTASLPPSPQSSPTPSLYILWPSPLNWKSIIRTSKHADSSTLIILVFT